MTTKTVNVNGMTERDAKHLADIDECIAEMAAIRREMKKTDVEIRRLRRRLVANSIAFAPISMWKKLLELFRAQVFLARDVQENKEKKLK